MLENMWNGYKFSCFTCLHERANVTRHPSFNELKRYNAGSRSGKSGNDDKRGLSIMACSVYNSGSFHVATKKLVGFSRPHTPASLNISLNFKLLTIILLIIGEIICIWGCVTKINYMKWFNIFILIIWNLSLLHIWMNRYLLKINNLNLIDLEFRKSWKKNLKKDSQCYFELLSLHQLEFTRQHSLSRYGILCCKIGENKQKQ